MVAISELTCSKINPSRELPEGNCGQNIGGPPRGEEGKQQCSCCDDQLNLSLYAERDVLL